MIETILIVEDQPDARLLLVELAGRTFAGAHIETASTIGQGRHALSLDVPDLALIDIGLPDGSGLDLIRDISHRCPETICVVTTVLDDDGHIVNAFSAGAHGYLLKGQAPLLIERQLRNIELGIPALSPTIARRVIEHFRRTGPIDEPDGILTEREQEVLSYIAKGMRNTDVARVLEVSATTVASHIKNIYRKLNISSRAEATRHATRIGLL
ncbi:LuxR C-terminal-related transcriptional regulator [Pelagibacterium sp.]|uniref:LuxR C-terminal-related transcriptional regulator n=1 Tax=Pelagibacterium sp. TaxID=1967288 RepID=UPI003BAA470C